MRGQQRHANDGIMKKDNNTIDDLRPEYDFSRMKGGVRGKYIRRYRAGTNLVKIDPDVAEVFASDNAVNEALRSLIKVARHQVKLAH
jgi:hypothetical protein